MRIFSFGGGVQSTAVLVLTAQGKIQYDKFLFCNVGEDSENPDTLRYFTEIALPFAIINNIELLELRKYRNGEIETLRGRIYATLRSVPIPARMSNGAPGHRTCTSDFKIRVIARWQKQHGATQANPAITGIGFSLDEYDRARTDSGFDWQELEYPLLDMRITRMDCMNIIKDAGLPIPSKSSCFFCPFHSPTEWIRLRQTRPDLFQEAVNIEKHIWEKRGELKKDRMWLHSHCKPLEIAVGDQPTLFDDKEICTSGYCFL